MAGRKAGGTPPHSDAGIHGPLAFCDGPSVESVRTKPRPLGLGRGFSYDNISELMAAAEGEAVEHNGVLHSTDADFSRFRGLKWRNPIGA